MFTREIRTEIEIEGTAQQVWDTLTDFESYSQWNSGFVKAAGRAKVGETLRITFSQKPGKTMDMHPTVLVADPGRELRWLGRLLMPAITILMTSTVCSKGTGAAPVRRYSTKSSNCRLKATNREASVNLAERELVAP